METLRFSNLVKSLMEKSSMFWNVYVQPLMFSPSKCPSLEGSAHILNYFILVST